MCLLDTCRGDKGSGGHKETLKAIDMDIEDKKKVRASAVHVGIDAQLEFLPNQEPYSGELRHRVGCINPASWNLERRCE